jgi:NAD kinase
MSNNANNRECLQKFAIMNKRQSFTTNDQNKITSPVMHHSTSQAVSFDMLADKIDLIICLGGDGTLLHISNLFQVKLASK